MGEWYKYVFESDLKEEASLEMVISMLTNK